MLPPGFAGHASRFCSATWVAAALAAVAGGCEGRSPAKHVTESTPVSVESLPRLRDGFEGDSLAPFWLPGDHGSGRYAPGAIILSTDYARSGRQSARVTVRQGDVAQLGDSGQPNERAELDSGKLSLLGRDAWYGFSLLIPPDFPEADCRLVIAQWKQSGLEGSPIVAQRLRAARHYVTIRDLRTRGSWRESFDLPRLVPGRWCDMVYHLKFATDSSGLVEIWMNGKLAARFEGPTASTLGSEQFYHKVGLYRDRMAEPMTIYIDNYATGDGFDAVDPARFELSK